GRHWRRPPHAARRGGTGGVGRLGRVGDVGHQRQAVGARRCRAAPHRRPVDGRPRRASVAHGHGGGPHLPRRQCGRDGGNRAGRPRRGVVGGHRPAGAPRRRRRHGHDGGRVAVIAAVATSHSRALWYLTRGSGLIALVLLTASVVLGVREVKRWATERWPRFMTAALHKNVSLLSVVFLGVHIATTVVDGFAPIGWLDAVVPFRSPYRPLWLGLGALSVDLLLALVVTSLLRARIGYRTWKAVHWAAYACWPVAVLHGMGTGTDTRL